MKDNFRKVIILLVELLLKLTLTFFCLKYLLVQFGPKPDDE